MVALKTFNNLPNSRQTEIIAACLEEFALHEYQAASLSTIVSNLQLAKGSFYRYFESKQALYFFLLDHCTKMRLENDEKYIDTSATDLFELLAQHFAAKLKFDKNYPLHSAFLYNVMREKNNEELGNIEWISKSKVMPIIKDMVAKQVKKKILRNDIDANAISFAIFQMQLMINDYIPFIYQVDFRENIRNKKQLYQLPEKELTKISNHFIEIFKNGVINLK